MENKANSVADDVRNQTVDGEDLQKEADVLCAFCFIFGLRLNSNKTEMFIKNYGGEKDINDRKEISLRIMDEKEKVVVKRMIMLQQNGKDKHLGITHDNERIGTSTLKKEIRMEIEEYCNKVKSKKYHRMGDKINCISTMIIPRGVYKLRNSALSNDELTELDKIVSRCYRNVCHTGPTFPTCLLYMPSKWGGMGFKRMSDTVNNQKMAHMFRKTNHAGMTKNALLALIELVCLEKGIETKSNLITEINSEVKLKDKTWLCRLVEDAAKWNVNLTIGGSMKMTMMLGRRVGPIL